MSANINQKVDTESRGILGKLLTPFRKVKESLIRILKGQFNIEIIFKKWFLLVHLIILASVITLHLVVPFSVYLKPVALILLLIIKLIPLYLISLLIIGIIGIIKQKEALHKFISLFFILYSLIISLVFLIYFGSFFGLSKLSYYLGNSLLKLFIN